jgi:hypothetical protein
MVHMYAARVTAGETLLRSLLGVAARYKFTFAAHHIPGVANPITDALSFQMAGVSSASPQWLIATNSSSSNPIASSVATDLETQCHSFLYHGLASSTHKTYAFAPMIISAILWIRKSLELECVASPVRWVDPLPFRCGWRITETCVHKSPPVSRPSTPYGTWLFWSLSWLSAFTVCGKGVVSVTKYSI